MIKQIIKSILPSKLFVYLKNIQTNKIIVKSYCYDFYRYKKYSRTFGTNSSEKLIGEIIATYHVIEKGLTMPDLRLGFGKDRIIQLCELCVVYIEKYGIEEEQLLHAVQVILEYEYLHGNKTFILDDIVNSSIKKLKDKTKGFTPSQQRDITRYDLFEHRRGDFFSFSNSRVSVRNFCSENIPDEKIHNALELARNTPSACNRQSWRTYVFTNKNHIREILAVQGGNRGFGQLTNKLIVVAGEIGVFDGLAERNQVFIDGGMYAMNLLYSLHYYEIAACILNCSNSPIKDKQLRSLCNIKNSEVFIAMIVCGNPVESFHVPTSKRYSLDKTNKLIVS
jgi:nitroreductase